MLTADFDHDGKDDYVFRGTRDETYVVAIIRGSSDKKAWFFRFSVKSPSHKTTEICSIDATIQTRSPVLLGSGRGMWHIPAQSKAVVVDDKCDPVNITWDQDKRSFELLRIHVSM
jgi:hypothetical protein